MPGHGHWVDTGNMTQMKSRRIDLEDDRDGELPIWGTLRLKTKHSRCIWTYGLELQGRSGQNIGMGIITGMVGFGDRDRIES